METWYNYYGKLKNNTNDLYFITDLDGNFVDANASTISTLGIKEDALLETNNLKDFLLNDSDWDSYLARIDNKKKSIIGFDITFRKEDGSIFSGQLNSLIVTDDGNQIYRVFLVHDLTMYVIASLDTMKLNLELMDLNKQLGDANNTITHQEKLASIGELSAGVAHEINNPLAFVSSNIKSLKKYNEKVFGYKFDLEEDQIEEFNFIKEDLESLFEETEEGIERIENITKSLKRFSRMDEASKTSKYDINKAIEDTILISKSQCPSHTEILLELSDIPLIECFANDINQVLLNMVINALQAQTEMGEDFKGYLKIKTEIDKNNLVLSIEDNGPGIPAEIESKIYDPFFTTKEIGKGTGLGLGICFNIINTKHNGTLWLDNSQNPTRFKIFLPIVLEGAENG